jgi:hypothetical protein
VKPKDKRSIWKKLALAPFEILAIIVALPVTLLFSTVLRGRCPNCHRRGLQGALCRPDQALTGDPRSFFLSVCDYCHHQFWSFEDASRTVVHITPEDHRYIRENEERSKPA